MKTKCAVARFLMVLALTAGFILGGSAVAEAWSNGEPANSYGTHDWILDQANQLAAADGANWVNIELALPITDDPDTVFYDKNFHFYDRWGDLQFGQAPTAVKYRYGLAVLYLKYGKVDAASRQVALLSHYYTDVWCPLHSNFECDTLVPNLACHLTYEADVLAHHPGNVEDDGYQRVADPAAATAVAANHSSQYLCPILAAYASGQGYGAAGGQVDLITQDMLVRAAQGLRDIIVTIAKAARW